MSDPTPEWHEWVPVALSEVGCWRWRTSTHETSWNDAARRLFGARPGESVEQTWRRVVQPEDRDRLQALERRRDEITTFTVRDGDVVRHLLSRTTHVRGDENGEEWRAGVILDVSSARRADERATIALQTMTEAFIAVDSDFRVTYMNASAETLVARRLHELLGQVVWEHFPHLAGGPVEQAYRTAVATGEVVTFGEVGASEGSWITSDVHPSPEGLNVYLRDATQLHRAAQEQARLLARLEHQASHDALTGLPNATLAARTATEHLASSPGATASLVSLDLDRFSLVNDTLGHTTGDQLLCEVARRLVAVAPPGALVHRSSGDEFGVLVLDAAPADVEAVASRALAAIREPVRLHAGDRRELHVTASAGLACTDGTARADGADGLGDLLRDVDIALHAAKRAGRDRALWCDADLQRDVADRARVERDLRRALDAPGQLALHYQPEFSLATGAACGAEALLRWTHPLRGPVPPSQVIPVAEESGLILPLGDWVIATAARQALAWSGVPAFTTWFNVAPHQLAAADVPGALAAVLATTGLPAARLGIEVTESVLADGSPAGAALAEVRALGVQVAIDDFGTGYSSLSRLLALPVDLVKIDRSFVAACESPGGAAVLSGIVDLAHGLGARVIAEGVETWAQLAVLRSTACDAVSGYLLARPAPAAEQHLRRARLSPPAPPRPRARRPGPRQPSR